MTLPNLLTLLRLLLTPAVAVLAYSPGVVGRAWALGLFLLAMATDVADGVIATRFNQRSRLGLYLDPVVDKVILLTMFFVLADLDLLPLWMALLMMARELLVDGVRSTAAATGRVIGANILGKTKACVQTACVGLGLGLRTLPVEHSTARLWVTALTGLALLMAWGFAGVFLWWNRSVFGSGNERP
jgi:CDP-diacylglycerol--glycerol-3-phosphate 3-phosphatidyltransferase